MSNHTVLVTGINGYIGSHIGLQLLRKGYIVRGASRSASAQSQLFKEAFKGFEQQYEHFVVPDMTAPGAFDEAVKGVHGIVHVASPIDFSLPDVEAFFGPAAGGVLSILNSAKATAGPQLKSFVMTSSIAAVTDRFKYPPEHVYDVSNWNTTSEPAARKQFNPGLAYGASKAIAERTFWDWREKNQVNFALSAVNPGLVMGPPVVWPESPEKLNESLLPVWKVYSGEKQLPAGIGMGTVIDIRDVAALHVWCVENPDKANRQRYIAVTGKMPPQAYADLLREHYPERDIVVGNPGEDYIPGTYAFPVGGVVADRMYAALGGKDNTINPAQMILDSVTAFENRWPGRAKNLKQ